MAGLIWALVSPTAAFCYAAAWMVAAVVAATTTRLRLPAPSSAGAGEA